jgi:hypothetical protein
MYASLFLTLFVAFGAFLYGVMGELVPLSHLMVPFVVFVAPIVVAIACGALLSVAGLFPLRDASVWRGIVPVLVLLSLAPSSLAPSLYNAQQVMARPLTLESVALLVTRVLESALSSGAVVLGISLLFEVPLWLLSAFRKQQPVDEIGLGVRIIAFIISGYFAVSTLRGTLPKL